MPHIESLEMLHKTLKIDPKIIIATFCHNKPNRPDDRLMFRMKSPKKYSNCILHIGEWLAKCSYSDWNWSNIGPWLGIIYLYVSIRQYNGTYAEPWLILQSMVSPLFIIANPCVPSHRWLPIAEVFCTCSSYNICMIWATKYRVVNMCHSLQISFFRGYRDFKEKVE